MNDIEKYYEKYQIYLKYLEESKKVEKNLLDNSKALYAAQKELSSYQNRLESEKKVSLPDFHSGMKEYTALANKKIDALQEEYAKTVRKIKKETSDKIVKNRDSYNAELDAFAKNDWDETKELTEDEKNCLEYTKRKKELEDECTSDIRALHDAFEKEKLSCQKDVNAFVVQQQKITESYNARITAQQNKIDDITDKYTEPVARFDTALGNEEEYRKSELAIIQKKIDERNEAFEDEQDELEERLSSLKRSYTAKVIQAKLSGADTEELTNNRDIKVAGIEASIEQSKKKYEEESDALQAQYDAKKKECEHRIATARKKADQIVAKRAEELAEPQMFLENLMSEKTQRIDQLDRSIQQRTSGSEELLNRYKAEIKSKESYRKAEERKLENELKQYAEMTNNGFEEVYATANSNFLPVEEKKDSYQRAVLSIANNVSAQKAQDVYNNAYQDLASETYEELTASAEECLNLPDEVPSFYINPVPVYIICAIVGALIIAGLYLGVKVAIAIAMIAGVVVGAGLYVGFRYLLNKKLYDYEKALALASEYRNMNAIRSYSSTKAISEESKRVRQLGEQIYNAKYGQDRSFRIHREKEDYIKKDYDRAMLAAQENAVGENNRILKERDDSVADYRLKCRSNLEQHRNKIDDLTRKEIFFEQRCKNLNAIVVDLTNEKQELDHWYNDFEDYRRTIHFNDFAGTPGEKLNDSIYIMAEDSNAVNEKSSSEPRPIVKLTYDEKPVVVLYDVDLIQSYVGEEKEEARRRTIEDILKTMMFAVKRANPTGLFKQYVYNDPMRPDSFNNDEAKRTMEIKSVVSTFESLLEEMAKNKTMVTFAHLVVEPGGGNEIELNTLQKVIPFYICEKNEWYSGLTDENSLYSQIKATTDESCIIEYDNGKILLNK